MNWSFFLKEKSDLSDVFIPFLEQLQKNKYVVKYLRLDNAGENIALIKQLTSLNSIIKIGYIAPSTPQQNGQVERASASLYGKM